MVDGVNNNYNGRTKITISESSQEILDRLAKLREEQEQEVETPTDNNLQVSNNARTKITISESSQEILDRLAKLREEQGQEVETPTDPPGDTKPPEDTTVPNATTTPPPSDTDYSFEGEVSKNEAAAAYSNRLNMKNADYKSIYKSLLADENLNAYDKYKLFQQLSSKGYEFNQVDAFNALLTTMSNNCANYSIDDIKFIESKRSEVCASYAHSNASAKAYAEAWCNFYKSGQYDFNELNEIYNVQSLATYVQQIYAGDEEAQHLKDIVSGLPQGDFKITETEPYRTNNIGKNQEYHNLVKVFDHYKDNTLSQEEAAYILVANYGNLDNLIKTFKSMTVIHEEEYLPTLIEIMSYQGQQSEESA